jgi:oligo-1,6-glucosidase
MVSRFGNPDPEFRTPSTQLLNTFLLSMRGTPYIYFGDELGMTNIDMPTIDQYVDIQAIGDYKKAEARGEDMNAFMEYLNYSSRENSRTPMQWDETLNAGFSTGTPWKKVNPNYPSINVAQQEADPNSVLNHFKKMTQIRKTNKVLVYGDYSMIQEEHPTVYAFKRFDEKSSHTILLNFSETNSEITLDEAFEGKTPLINNYQQLQIEGNTITLLPYQAVVF